MSRDFCILFRFFARLCSVGRVLQPSSNNQTVDAQGQTKQNKKTAHVQAEKQVNHNELKAILRVNWKKIVVSA